MSTVTYEIVIPKEDITHKIMRETVHSASYCPVAMHFKNQGYNVMVGGNRVYFFPANLPACVSNMSVALDAGLDYLEELHDASEAEEDFRGSIDLPYEIYHAEHGSKYRR